MGYGRENYSFERSDSLMKFLLNMNIPRELGKRLKSKGHKTRHVGDIGMAKASDMAIIEESRKNKETIITHDLDYGNLLAFSGESTPSIILFRVRNTHIDNLFKRIVESWKEIEKSLVKGAIIVLEDTLIRIRVLPIIKEKLE